MAETLRIALRGGRQAFAPRARWVLEELASALGHDPVFVDDERADLVYAARRPERGVWIPLQTEAQAFFEGTAREPGPAVHRAGGLALLFPPSPEAGPIPGDVVASAFYLMARWDELRAPERDRFGRLPLAESAFARIAGLDLEDPPVEGYLRALRRELGLPAAEAWSVALTHDIDRIRRRTPRGLAGIARRRGPAALARALVAPDPWNNAQQMVGTTARRGLAATAYLIGHNRHPLDGTPRRAYERERGRWAAAVRAGGGEVGLHASFASSEDGEALATELARLRAEVGEVRGVRFHYLRFRYHETVRWLEAAGVDYDASLGFSEAPGFAAGLARPFRPYLVGEERPAGLLLLPLAVMDTTLHGHLGLGAADALERATSVLGAVREAGGRASVLWHNTFLADDRAPGYGGAWELLLERLAEDGAELGPVQPPSQHGAELGGMRALHLTSVHGPRDVRIFHKEARALAAAGAHAETLAPRQRLPRVRRPLAAARLAVRARRRDADVYHLHDPELLPVGLWLRHATGRAVIYDAHEYLESTARTKRWIPAALRRPVAAVAGGTERALARRLDGVVAANGDLAARFATAGAPEAVAVTNAPWRADFPSATPLPDEPVVLYVGGLGPLRGLPVMLEAFPRVEVPRARLVLAGPGDPGALPDRVQALGVVSPEEVPGLLADARVAWVPLQRHGNYDRAVPTKLVEAMAAGRPVVASDLGTMGFIVRAAGCGIVVPPDDPDAHARALSRLLADDELAARMGRAGREAVERGDLVFERQAERLSALYARVAG